MVVVVSNGSSGGCGSGVVGVVVKHDSFFCIVRRSTHKRPLGEQGRSAAGIIVFTVYSGSFVDAVPVLLFPDVVVHFNTKRSTSKRFHCGWHPSKLA